jgi:hypothetical protein
LAEEKAKQASHAKVKNNASGLRIIPESIYTTAYLPEWFLSSIDAPITGPMHFHLVISRQRLAWRLPWTDSPKAGTSHTSPLY